VAILRGILRGLGIQIMNDVENGRGFGGILANVYVAVSKSRDLSRVFAWHA
jgi:hypothetical protein